MSSVVEKSGQSWFSGSLWSAQNCRSQWWQSNGSAVSVPQSLHRGTPYLLVVNHTKALGPFTAAHTGSRYVQEPACASWGMHTDWRAVGGGVAVAVAYLTLLALLPGLEGVRLGGIPLVLATGLVAGAAAGVFADRGPTAGSWHGLLAGSASGAAFAAVLVYVFVVNEPYGVFHGLNYVVARSAVHFPIVATAPDAVVAGLAGAGWALIAGLGSYAGHAAPRREGDSLIEE